MAFRDFNFINWRRLALLAGLLLTACSSDNPDSRKFLAQAMDDGLSEIRVSKLALTQSQDDEVKDFARRIIRDRADINREFNLLANEKSVPVPAEASTKRKATYDKLARLSGSSFDREFLRHNVSDHESDVLDFRRQAEIGDDPDVRGLAAKALKPLQVELQMSRDLAEKIRARS